MANSTIRLISLFLVIVSLTNCAPVSEKKAKTVSRADQVVGVVTKNESRNDLRERIAPPSIVVVQQQQQQVRRKRQGYYNLGNTDYKPAEYNDGVSNQQLANPLSPAHQMGGGIFGDTSGDPNQLASGWVGQEFQGDVGQAGANIVENAGQGNYHSPYLGNAAGGHYGQGSSSSSSYYYGTVNQTMNGNTQQNNTANGNGNGNGHANGNGYTNGNGNGNGNGGYNPFANVRPNQQASHQNYLQTNYGVQGNLYNPLLHSIYGYQFQQKQPFVSEQENSFGKPQNQLGNQAQTINNPNIFGGYGEYNSPLTFEQIYGPYLNTAGYNPTTTTKKPKTTTEPPRKQWSKSFNPYEGMTTRRLPVTPQVLWYSRYVDLTAPIAAVPFSNYNNI